MKNSEVMPASLEGYSFDPEPQATIAGSRKAEVAALRRQANEELGGDAWHRWRVIHLTPSC
ncbi:hypothetical protein [Bacillus sp. 2205SS5-2]|uniref:hypothetical protein n=1 Tax=Bacillus sp. 2205SS5-2 TaxID=3109031 RepID=UPI003004E8AD